MNQSKLHDKATKKETNSLSVSLAFMKRKEYQISGPIFSHEETILPEYIIINNLTERKKKRGGEKGRGRNVLINTNGKEYSLNKILKKYAIQIWEDGSVSKTLAVQDGNLSSIPRVHIKGQMWWTTPVTSTIL